MFEQVNEIRDDKPGSTDPNDTKSGRLNGEDRQIGTSLLMHVMAGDQVEMNVNNYYDSYDADNDDPVPGEQMLDNIVNTLTGGVGGFEGSEGHNPDMVQQLFTPDNYLAAYRNAIAGQVDQSRPKAFLNYILFDENMRIDKSFSNAFQVNSNGSWQEIGTSTPLTIPTNGYLAIYLSNESRGGCYECNDVNFDLVRVKLQKGKQLEETHYYPFGLPMQGLSSAAENNTITQRRKYQSNEYIKDLGLNWMDFHARQYDPQIGRFLGVDPLAASGGQDRFSPYAAMGNAPESMVDPNGTQQLSFSGMGNPQLEELFGGDLDRTTGLLKGGVDRAEGVPEGGSGSGGAGGGDTETSGASGLTTSQMIDNAVEAAGGLVGYKSVQGKGNDSKNLMQDQKFDPLRADENGWVKFSIGSIDFEYRMAGDNTNSDGGYGAELKMFTRGAKDYSGLILFKV